MHIFSLPRKYIGKFSDEGNFMSIIGRSLHNMLLKLKRIVDSISVVNRSGRQSRVLLLSKFIELSVWECPLA